MNYEMKMDNYYKATSLNNENYKIEFVIDNSDDESQNIELCQNNELCQNINLNNQDNNDEELEIIDAFLQEMENTSIYKQQDDTIEKEISNINKYIDENYINRHNFQLAIQSIHVTYIKLLPYYEENELQEQTRKLMQPFIVSQENSYKFWLKEINNFESGCLLQFLKLNTSYFLFIQIQYIKIQSYYIPQMMSAIKIHKLTGEIADFATFGLPNIKINKTYGNIYNLLMDPDIEYILYYSIDPSPIEIFLLSNIMPWYDYIKDKKCINLIKVFKFEKNINNFIQNLCIDSDIHNTMIGCIHCNLILNIFNLRAWAIFRKNVNLEYTNKLKYK